MSMGARVGRNTPKSNNTAAASNAKATIRRNVLARIGADRAHVLDAFAGDGHMYRAVWHQAASYTGCDLKFYAGDTRRAYVVDNLRLLRAIDLTGFTLFDLDAYGCPWQQALIIATRRKIGAGETIGLVLTEGNGLKMKFGGMSHALAQLVKMRHWLPGLGRAQDDILNRAITNLAGTMNCAVTDRWEANGKIGSSMRYIGLVLEGKPAS